MLIKVELIVVCCCSMWLMQVCFLSMQLVLLGRAMQCRNVIRAVSGSCGDVT